MNFRGYHGLTVWNRAVDLVELIYHLTDALRSTAAPEVLSDMRRNVLAIPTHLAAGYQAQETEDYLRHVHTAQVNLARLETQTTILERLQWTDDDELRGIKTLLTHLHQLLGCLERYLAGGPQPEAEAS